MELNQRSVNCPSVSRRKPMLHSRIALQCTHRICHMPPYAATRLGFSPTHTHKTHIHASSLAISRSLCSFLCVAYIFSHRFSSLQQLIEESWYPIGHCAGDSRNINAKHENFGCEKIRNKQQILRLVACYIQLYVGLGYKVYGEIGFFLFVSCIQPARFSASR